MNRIINQSIIYLIPLLSGITVTAQHKPSGTVEIITDTRFQNGIGLIGANSSQPEIIDTLRPFGKSVQQQTWKMPQWATRFDLKGIKPVKIKDTICYRNEGKKVTFNRTGNSTLVGLEVFGSNEYTAPRKDNESWPHLLLEQRTNQTRLSQMKALNYNINARLMYAINKTGAAYNTGLHSAQVTLYLLIQNVNASSAGMGDYFWFGLPLYDYRYRDIKEYAAQDLGKADATKKFILNVASETLYEGSLMDKKWVNIHKNIYPLIQDAFKKAKQNGYLKTTAFEDLAIESTNVGWEVPGTFDCGLQFKNLALTATL